MYCAGEYVMYSGEGLCLIESVGIPEHQDGSRQYYFLRSLLDNSRIYTPVDTAVPMRRPMSGPEAVRFLRGLPRIRVEVPRALDSKKRLDVIRETLRPQTAEAMARTVIIIRSLHPEGIIPVYEKTLLTRTEKSLCKEIAYALQIPEEAAAQRIYKAIQAHSAQG